MPPTLELIGTWEPTAAETEWSTVYGVAAGRWFTLTGVTVLSRQRHLSIWPVGEKTTLQCLTVLDGAHVADLMAQGHAAFRLEVPALDAWCELSAISSTLLTHADGTTIRGQQVTITPPEPVVLRIPHGELAIGMHATATTADRRGLVLEQRAIVTVTCDTPCTLAAMLEQIARPLLTAVTLLSNEPARLGAVSIRLVDNEGTPQWCPWHLHTVLRDPPAMTPTARAPLAPLSWVLVQQPDFFMRWFEYAERLRAPVTLFWSTESGVTESTAVQLMLRTQALETLHKATSVADGQDDAEGERDVAGRAPRRRHGVPGAQDRSPARRRAEPSLRERLRRLVARVNGALSAVYVPDEAFIGQLVDVRNALTHDGPTRPIDRAAGRDLLVLNAKARVLLVLALLDAAGLGEEALRTLVRESLGLVADRQLIALEAGAEPAA